MILTVGQKLLSVADATSVIVIRTTTDDVDLTCGESPMIDAASAEVPRPSSPVPASSAPVGSALGKRYVDEHNRIELLCVKGGPSTLAIAGQPMSIKSAKPLPASD